MRSLTFTTNSIPDLAGKTYIVTGGNSGLVSTPLNLPTSRCFVATHPRILTAAMQGYETALQLALHSGHVIIATHAQDVAAPMPADEIDGPGSVCAMGMRPIAAAAVLCAYAHALRSCQPHTICVRTALCVCAVPWARSRPRSLMLLWSTWSWTCPASRASTSLCRSSRPKACPCPVSAAEPVCTPHTQREGAFAACECSGGGSIKACAAGRHPPGWHTRLPSSADTHMLHCVCPTLARLDQQCRPADTT